MNIEERVKALEDKCEVVIQGRNENGLQDKDFEWRLKIVEKILKKMEEREEQRAKDSKQRTWQVALIILSVVITQVAVIVISKMT